MDFKFSDFSDLTFKTMAKTSNQKKPRPEKIKKQNKIKNCDKQKPLKKTTFKSNWEKPHIINYIVYLMAFGDQFQKGSQMTQVYEDMAEYIEGAKTPQQCRQYHCKNKMIIKSIEKIIESFIKKYQLETKCMKQEAERIRQEKDKLQKELFQQESQGRKSEDFQQHAQSFQQSAYLQIRVFHPFRQRQDFKEANSFDQRQDLKQANYFDQRQDFKEANSFQQRQDFKEANLKNYCTVVLSQDEKKQKKHHSVIDFMCVI